MWPFLRWARLHEASADFLSESDAVALGNELAQDYDLIVVPTHLEYVTEAEYDALQHYRDAGGDLIFLASNDLYWKVEIDGTSMRRVAKWRDSAARSRRSSARSTRARRRTTPRRTSSRARARPRGRSRARASSPDALFSNAGDEFDLTTAASPPGTQVLATVRTPTTAAR